MWLLGIAAAALAGGVYLNGTPVDTRSLQGVTLERVNVRVDAQGNVYIDAPGYRIEVQPPVGMVAPPVAGPINPVFAPVGVAAPTPPVAPAAPAYPAYPAYPAVPAAPAAPAAQAFGPGAYPPAPVASLAPPIPPPAPAAYPSGVARGRWWLVTDDKGSLGHTVEIHVNGQLVHTVRSGEPQRIVDVGAFLRPGANEVVCRSFSSQDNNGTFYLYLGSGADVQGTVRMDPPQVQFGVGTNTTFMNERSFSLNIP